MFDGKNEEIQKMGEIRELQEEVLPNRRKLGVGGGHTSFKFQFHNLLAGCTYSTSLSLKSLFSEVIFICRVALRSKYFIGNAQSSVNGAA